MAVRAVYEWDAKAEQWRRFIPDAPVFLNNLGTLQPGRSYWVIASAPTAIVW
jgi:hypothetical protein